jgi:hypothetical protein
MLKLTTAQFAFDKVLSFIDGLSRILRERILTVYAKMDWTLRLAHRESASAVLAVQCNNAQQKT